MVEMAVGCNLAKSIGLKGEDEKQVENAVGTKRV